MPLSSQERAVLDAIHGLQKDGLPAVPFAIAIRSGIKLDHCSQILETLRKKGALGDINNPGRPR